jgi:hypothetical protein
MEVSDVRQRLDDLDFWADGDWGDAEPASPQDWPGSGLGSALRQVMHEGYADASDADFDDAAEAVLSEMSPAEAFGFENVLRQIQRGAGQALSSPLAAQIAQTALPIGAGGLGTVIGGPLGTAIGSQLGTFAANALVPQPRKAGPAAIPVPPSGSGGTVPVPAGPPVPTVPTGQATAANLPVPAGVLPIPGAAPVPAAAGGSAAAAQAAVLAGTDWLPKMLAALAVGQAGAREINGVGVAQFMDMFSKMISQAAADADEMAYLDAVNAGGDESESNGYTGDPAIGTGRSLYMAIVDADNEELAP